MSTKKTAAGKAGGLTLKQQRFVHEYLKDQNGTQAAIRTGYSEKTAKQQGSRLLTDPHVALRDHAGGGALREAVRDAGAADGGAVQQGDADELQCAGTGQDDALVGRALRNRTTEADARRGLHVTGDDRRRQHGCLRAKDGRRLDVRIVGLQCHGLGVLLVAGAVVEAGYGCLPAVVLHGGALATAVAEGLRDRVARLGAVGKDVEAGLDVGIGLADHRGVAELGDHSDLANLRIGLAAVIGIVHSLGLRQGHDLRRDAGLPEAVDLRPDPRPGANHASGDHQVAGVRVGVESGHEPQAAQPAPGPKRRAAHRG